MRRQNSGEEWLDIWNNHQDWFFRDINGDYVTRTDTYDWETIEGEYAYLLDISNNEVKEWLFQWIKEKLLSGNFDGMFLDLMLPYYPGHVWRTKPVVSGNPITNQQWQNLVLEYQNYLKKRQGETPELEGKILIFNGLDNGQVFEGHNGIEFLRNSPLDGTLLEGFMRWQDHPANYYKSEEEWKGDIDALQEITTQESEKSLLVSVKNGTEEDFDKHLSYYLYSYASFLLGYNSDNASFLYRGRNFPPLGEHWLPYIRPQTIDLGKPVAQYGYDSTNNLYYRDFKNGKVFVNPKEIPTSIIAEDDYLNLLSNEVYRGGDTIEILPRGAAILIYGRECLPGDANGDGRVDSEDFALLVADYLSESVNNTDFNSDGRVDSEDFAILQTNFTPH